MAANAATVGQLRTRLRLQTATETRTASGGITRTWATDTTVWAAVRPLTGREFVEAARVDATVTHQVVIRWQLDITVNPTKRFLFANDTSRALNILSATTMDERRRFVVCACKEDV